MIILFTSLTSRDEIKRKNDGWGEAKKEKRVIAKKARTKCKGAVAGKDA